MQAFYLKKHHVIRSARRTLHSIVNNVRSRNTESMPVRKRKAPSRAPVKRKKRATRKPRNYRKEYDSYHAKPRQKKRRAQRNSARAKMVKAGKARKGDGKDVDHKNRNTADNRSKNLRVVSKSKNRSFPRKRKSK